MKGLGKLVMMRTTELNNYRKKMLSREAVATETSGHIIL